MSAPAVSARPIARPRRSPKTPKAAKTSKISKAANATSEITQTRVELVALKRQQLDRLKKIAAAMERQAKATQGLLALVGSWTGAAPKSAPGPGVEDKVYGGVNGEANGKSKAMDAKA